MMFFVDSRFLILLIVNSVLDGINNLCNKFSSLPFQSAKIMKFNQITARNHKFLSWIDSTSKAFSNLYQLGKF